jgi:hypothetical protein
LVHHVESVEGSTTKARTELTGQQRHRRRFAEQSETGARTRREERRVRGRALEGAGTRERASDVRTPCSLTLRR